MTPFTNCNKFSEKFSFFSCFVKSGCDRALRSNDFCVDVTKSSSAPPLTRTAMVTKSVGRG